MPSLPIRQRQHTKVNFAATFGQDVRPLSGPTSRSFYRFRPGRTNQGNDVKNSLRRGDGKDCPQYTRDVEVGDPAGTRQKRVPGKKWSLDPTLPAG